MTILEVPQTGSIKLYIKDGEYSNTLGTYKQVARTFANVKGEAEPEDVQAVGAAIASLYKNRGQTITPTTLDMVWVQNTMLVGMN